MFSRLHRLLSGGLRRQLILSVATVHAVMMIFFVWDLSERQKALLLERQAEQASAMALTLSTSAAGWLAARDISGLQELVDAQRRYPELDFAILLDQRGQVLAHSDRHHVGLYLQDLPARPRHAVLSQRPALVDVATPVMLDKRHVGWARVGIGQKQAAEKLGEITRDGLLYALAAIVIGSFMAWFLGHRLTAKLYVIQRVSEAVRGGNPGARTPDLGEDEAGRLAKDFNAMLDALADRESELTATRDALAHSEERFDLAMRGASDGIWDWNLVGNTVYFSPRWKEMIGYLGEEIGDSPDEWSSRVHPDDLPMAQAAVQDYLRGERENYEVTFRFRHRDGRYLWILARGMVIRDARGTPLRLVGTHVDITARRQLEEELFEEKELAHVTLASIGDGVLVTDGTGRIVFLNPVAEQLTGWPLEEARGRGVDEIMRLYNEVTGELAEDPVGRCLKEGVVVGMANHTVLVARDGNHIAVEDSAAPIFDRSGVLIGVVMVFHDVTAARQISQQMSWQVAHDSLTGLYNRREFEHRLGLSVESAKVSGSEHALLYLDLDQFKIVNDTCGHMAGDDLLRQLAFLMQEQMRKNDLLARLGGDEFGILLENCALEKALAIADKLRAVVKEFRFSWQDKVFEIGVSIGLVQIDRAALDASEILSAADVACYAAKDMGRNRVHVYRPEDREHAGRHGEMHMASNVRAAIHAERLVLYAQEIRALKPELKVGHFEVLVRIREEDGNLLTPGAFIPAAERYGLMPDVDRWVIRQALRMVGRTRGKARINLAINLSGHSLLDHKMPAFIRAQLDESGVRPDSICFEITETAAIAHLGQGVQFMRELKALGCRFSLDDFGSGMSSFGYLKALPVDYLKIDGAFVRDMVTDKIDRAFVETINRIGQVMGMETIAEFAESEVILRELTHIGVDYAQGYGVAEPIPLEDALRQCGIHGMAD